LLEALACGVPVAAFDVMGPKDVIPDRRAGILGADLNEAALAALGLDREACRAYAEQFSWNACAQRFRDIIAEARGFASALPANP
jgi:glycosyltransferase involved in cell wall biosynthesis